MKVPTQALARASARHPWRTIAAWIVVAVLAVVALVGLLPGALTTEGKPTNNPESERASDVIGRAFPPDPRRLTTDLVIVRSGRYTVSSPQFRAFVARLVAEGRATGVVSSARSYLSSRDPSLVSRDRHATLIPIAVGDVDDIPKVVDVAEKADADPTFAVAITGNQTLDNDFNKLSQEDLQNGELKFGLPAALVILLLVFGAVVAGLVPVLLAIVSRFGRRSIASGRSSQPIRASAPGGSIAQRTGRSPFCRSRCAATLQATRPWPPSANCAPRRFPRSSETRTCSWEVTPRRRSTTSTR